MKLKRKLLYSFPVHGGWSKDNKENGCIQFHSYQDEKDSGDLMESKGENMKSINREDRNAYTNLQVNLHRGI